MLSFRTASFAETPSDKSGRKRNDTEWSPYVDCNLDPSCTLLNIPSSQIKRAGNGANLSLSANSSSGIGYPPAVRFPVIFALQSDTIFSSSSGLKHKRNSDASSKYVHYTSIFGPCVLTINLQLSEGRIPPSCSGRRVTTLR